MTVIHDCEPRIKIGVITEHRFYNVIVERVAYEKSRVWFKEYVCTVLVFCISSLVVCKVAFFKLQRPNLAVSVRLYFEVGG